MRSLLAALAFWSSLGYATDIPAVTIHPECMPGAVSDTTYVVHSVAEFRQNYEAIPSCKRNGTARTLCEELFLLWESNPQAYSAEFLDAGRNWDQPSSYLTERCHTIWFNSYLRPMQMAAVQNQDRIVITANRIRLSSKEVLDAQFYLPEYLRLMSNIYPRHNDNIPPGPYEVMMGMAVSTDRELDEVLHRELAESINIVATRVTTEGGILAATLAGLRNVFTGVAASSVTASSFFKGFLVVAGASWAAGELTEGLMNAIHENNLWDNVVQPLNRLRAGNPDVPTEVLLNELEKSLVRLGYHYSYDLYLFDAQLATDTPAASEQCYQLLYNYFENPISVNLVESFANRSICKDAVAIWIGAAQYLRALRPNDGDVLWMAELLLQRANDTFLIYQSTRTEEMRFALSRATTWHCPQEVTLRITPASVRVSNFKDFYRINQGYTNWSEGLTPSRSETYFSENGVEHREHTRDWLYFLNGAVHNKFWNVRLNPDEQELRLQTHSINCYYARQP